MDDPDLAAGEECKSRGNTHFKKGEFEQAAEAYGEAIKCKPDWCVFWLNRSNAYRQLQRWADAEKDAAEALRLDPVNAKAHYARVVCLQRLGSLEKALASCEVGLSQHPDNKALQQIKNDIVNGQKEQDARNRREARREAEEKARKEAILARATTPRAASSSSSSSSSSEEGGYTVSGSTKKKKEEPRAIREDEIPSMRLCEAAARGDTVECKKLIASGTLQDINWQRPEDGNTALHLAAEDSHLNAVSLLLTHGANPEVTNDFLLRPHALATPGGATEKMLEEFTKPLGEDRRNAYVPTF